MSADNREFVNCVDAGSPARRAAWVIVVRVWIVSFAGRAGRLGRLVKRVWRCVVTEGVSAENLLRRRERVSRRVERRVGGEAVVVR